jgi:tetratricopeptide (TPR) repeat protein
MATSARIDELRKKFDENPRRYFAPLANEYRKAGDPEQAVFICEEYLPQQPGHMSGHIVYGQALFDLGRYGDARAVFETALSLDPENLIALRHLGDIARQAGDAHAARVWYQRVLEADPRNEEIGQLMMSLLATPAGSPAVDYSAPTPLSTPAVQPSAEARPPAPTPAIPATAQPAANDPPAYESQTPRTTSPSLTPVSPPSPQSFVSRHAPAEDELLDLDSFDLGGVPLSSLRNAREAEAEVEPAASQETREPVAPELAALESEAAHIAGDEEMPSESSEDEEFIDAPFGQLSAESEPSPAAASRESAEIEKSREFTAEDFEQDSYAIAARPLAADDAVVEPPPGEVELATDIALGLPDESDVPPLMQDDASLDGIETFEAGLVAGRPSSGSSAEAIATESFFETPTDVADETFVEEPTGLGSPNAALVESAMPTGNLELPTETTPDAMESYETPSILEPESEPEIATATESAADVQPEAEAQDEGASAPPLRTPQFERAIEFVSPPPPPLPTPHFQEAVPFEPHGDPLRTPAFGAVEPLAEAAVAPEAESSFAHDAASADSLSDIFDEQIGDAAPPEGEAAENVDAMATADSAEAELHVPSADADADAVADAVADADADAVADGPGAFVTETMATLYLEQGHYDAAIDIYRRLVQQRPDDIALRDRLHAAEERAWGHERDLGTALLADEAEAAPAPRSFGGPTIRDFLTGILYRRSTAVAAEEPAPAEALPDDTEAFDAAESASDAGTPPAARASATPSSGDSVGSSLGALFSGADAAAPPTEPAAESALGGRMVTPTTGTPAHRATNELSLDHVFKANTGRATGDQAFSFDQFFSEGAAEPASPTAEPTNESRPDSTDDIAQFNAWLNGLKKP